MVPGLPDWAPVLAQQSARAPGVRSRSGQQRCAERQVVPRLWRMQPERARLPSSDSGLVLEQLRLGSLLGPVPWKEPAGTPPDKNGHSHPWGTLAPEDAAAAPCLVSKDYHK